MASAQGSISPFGFDIVPPAVEAVPSEETTTIRFATVGFDEVRIGDIGNRPPVTTTSGRYGRLNSDDASKIKSAPSERLALVSSTLPLAGLLRAELTLAVGSGMSRRPLWRAAVTMARQPLTFSSRLGHGLLALTTMPASFGPPPLASNIAYSPCQLSEEPSLVMTTALRSSTGKSPCGPWIRVERLFAAGGQE